MKKIAFRKKLKHDQIINFIGNQIFEMGLLILILAFEEFSFFILIDLSSFLKLEKKKKEENENFASIMR